MLTLQGQDNYGKPRQEFAVELAALDERGFVCRAETCIWLSAYASNNPRSDFHWQADTCYDEARRRGDVGLYERAYNRAVASAS